MKRFLTWTIILLFLMMPLTSSAKVAISDNDLDAVTAEAGVSITFTNVTVGGTSKLTSISIGDPSGFTGYLTPGYFGFGNFVIGGNLMTLSGTMNVDIYTNSSSETKVNIALPTMTIGGAEGMNVYCLMKADSTSTLNSASASVGGIIDIRGFSTQVTGSIAIFAHD